MSKMVSVFFPYTSIKLLPGDVLYSSLGRSTYYVGHAVIIGTDGMCKEALPGRPAGNELTVQQLWKRHHKGDRILLMRSHIGGEEAAIWATEQLRNIKQYHLLNYDLNTISQNYCFKFIAQAYYYGAGIALVGQLNKLITPFAFKRIIALKKIALIEVG